MPGPARDFKRSLERLTFSQKQILSKPSDRTRISNSHSPPSSSQTSGGQRSAPRVPPPRVHPPLAVERYGREDTMRSSWKAHLCFRYSMRLATVRWSSTIILGEGQGEVKSAVQTRRQLNGL